MTEPIENQTQFIEDQVLNQQPHAAPVVQTPPTAATPVAVKKKPPLKLFLFGGAGAFFVLTLIIMMLSGMGKNSLQLMPNPSPSPTPSSINSSEFEKNMMRLSQDIDKADPTVNDLPYPPVSGSLYIVPQNK